MPVPIFHGDVRDGKIRFDRPDQLRAFVPTLEGKRIELVLRPEKKPLTRKQRGYLHVALQILADHLGRSLGELKAIVKLKFLWDGETVDRAGLPVVPSTESLSEQQYARLIDDVIRLGAECDCSIPGPGEVEA